MEQFDSLEKIKNLFKQATGEENPNACYIVGIIDHNNNAAVVGGVLGGALGGAIGGAIGAASAVSSGIVKGMEQQCEGFLFMQTDEGIGLIPLVRDGIAWANPYKKMRTCVGNYTFIRNEDIKEIRIKSANFGAAKKITIILNNKDKIQVLSYKRDRYLSFQKDCLEKFCSKYTNK
ncbi:MAG: hypothetical protein K6B70_05740 [Clostridia bacterium]|nr:hypothetical protein [Clostridia bacterium]